MSAAYEGEFDRAKRPGDLLIQWRNKQISQWEKVDRRWHKYKWMSETEANAFMQNCSPNSSFFEYKILKSGHTELKSGSEMQD